MLSKRLRKLIPESIVNRVKTEQQKRLKTKIQQLPPISAEEMESILRTDLAISEGDLVFVHSSVDRMNLSFPFFQILGMLRSIIGPQGTLVFPTYPPLSAYRFLETGEVFDVRQSPSYTGILSEFARRQKKGVRSLHPTKSVVAIGPLAEHLTADHHSSPFPYDVPSPYYRTIEAEGKVIGIGVGTFNLSLVHCVDDIMREEFPVNPYHTELFHAACINRVGETVVVDTFAHDMKKMGFDIPSFMAAHIEPDVALDIMHNGMHFFRADAALLYREMTDLARKGITIYDRKFYKR